MNTTNVLVLLGIVVCLFSQNVSGNQNSIHVFDEVDYYELLEVSTSATASQLKSQYRKRSLLLHPDKSSHPNANALFQQLSKAYETLKDPKSRELYNIHGSTWEYIQSYKEKLVTFERQMYRRGHQMFMQNVKVQIEEPFLNDRNVQIVHHSFAPALLGSFNGIWVLFFSSPNCGACKTLTHRIQEFARHIRSSRSDRVETGDASSRIWLRVGAVNMAVSDNQYLFENFGSASHSVPQIVLLSPNNTAPEYPDFEVVPQQDWRELSSSDFTQYLLQKAKVLMSRSVPNLPLHDKPNSSIETLIEGASQTLKGSSASSSVLVVMALSSSSRCESCSELVPVLRRMADKYHGSGIEFRVLKCHQAESPNVSACDRIESFPKLFIHSGVPGARLVELDIGEGFNTEEIQKYNYSPTQMGFSVLLSALRDIHSHQLGNQLHFPHTVSSVEVPDSVAFLRGDYNFVGMKNGKPYWKHQSRVAYLRWLPGRFRGNQQGAWILGDVDQSIDQGWAFLEEDIFVPVRSLTCWNVINNGRFKRSNAFGFTVPNRERNSKYKETFKTRPLPVPLTHDEL